MKMRVIPSFESQHVGIDWYQVTRSVLGRMDKLCQGSKIVRQEQAPSPDLIRSLDVWRNEGGAGSGETDARL